MIILSILINLRKHETSRAAEARPTLFGVVVIVKGRIPLPFLLNDQNHTPLNQMVNLQLS